MQVINLEEEEKIQPRKEESKVQTHTEDEDIINIELN